MRLTVVGSSASHAAAGQACAGHLVEGGGARVMLDCGNGSLANVYRVADPLTIDAVFITHNHPDHYVDLYSMQAMLRYAPEGPAAPVALHMPAELYGRMQALLSERGAAEFREAFAFTPLTEGHAVRIKDMTVTPFEVDHTDPTFAMVVEADGARLCYTSDTAPGSRVLRAAHGCDLLLAEATLPDLYAGVSPHLTARQAGELAVRADAGELVLTHVWYSNDRKAMAREAAEAYGGPISIAEELDTYDVSRKETRL